MRDNGREEKKKEVFAETFSSFEVLYKEEKENKVIHTNCLLINYILKFQCQEIISLKSIIFIKNKLVKINCNKLFLFSFLNPFSLSI